MAEEEPYSPFGRDDPRTTRLTEEDVAVVRGKSGYVRGREYDLREILYRAGFPPTKIESVPFSKLHDLMAEAWQYGWTSGLAHQELVDEAVQRGQRQTEHDD